MVKHNEIKDEYDQILDFDELNVNYNVGKKEIILKINREKSKNKSIYVGYVSFEEYVSSNDKIKAVLINNNEEEKNKQD